MSEGAQISVRDGRVYLSSAAFDRYFAGSGGVVLLRGGDDLLVLPVRHAAAGGYIPKIRNAAGDRVVTAPDFFRSQGLADAMSWQGGVAWSERDAALVLHSFFVDK